jgi:hypothetical protein
MANLIRMTDIDRLELTGTDFSSFTGDVYIKPMRSQDKAYTNFEIFADTIADQTVFNTFDDGTAVPNGSVLKDIASGGTLIWDMVGGSWVERGEVT